MIEHLDHELVAKLAHWTMLLMAGAAPAVLIFVGFGPALYFAGQACLYWIIRDYARDAFKRELRGAK